MVSHNSQPAFVRTVLYGVKSRKTAIIYSFLALVFSVVGFAYGKIALGTAMAVALLCYIYAIRWMDTRNAWEVETPPFAAKHIATLAIAVIVGLGALYAFQPGYFKMAVCMAQHSKEECVGRMLVGEGKSIPLMQGDVIEGVSGEYHITIYGSGWLKNGWGGRDPGRKDLGLLKQDASGFLDIEKSSVNKEEFANSITRELQGNYNNLQKAMADKGLKISLRSSLETYPLKQFDTGSLMGRLCYTIEQANKSLCIYQAHLIKTNQVYTLSGSILDVGNEREGFESTLLSMSFQ